MRLAATVVLLLVCLASFVLPAEAQVGEPRVTQPVVVGPFSSVQPGPVVERRDGSLSERLLLRQQWVAYREHQRREIRIAGPVVGLILGVGMLACTTWLLTRDQTASRLAGGFLTGLFSAPTLGVSTWVLTKRVRQRRAIDREIWSAPPISSTPFGFRF